MLPREWMWNHFAKSVSHIPVSYQSRKLRNGYLFCCHWLNPILSRTIFGSSFSIIYRLPGSNDSGLSPTLLCQNGLLYKCLYFFICIFCQRTIQRFFITYMFPRMHWCTNIYEINSHSYKNSLHATKQCFTTSLNVFDKKKSTIRLSYSRCNAYSLM